MARKRRFVGGRDVGKVSKSCYVCQACGFQHDRKPALCCNPPYCDCTLFDRFDSKGEATFWAGLKLRERAGDIQNLRRQTRFDLIVVETKIGEYIADFDYMDKDGVFHVLDFKPKDKEGRVIMTDLAHWKHKHLAAQSGIQVEIVTSK